MAKIKLKYTVVNGRNPRTSEPLLYPKVTGRVIVDTDASIDYCQKNGYIRGQTEDLKGTINGYLQGVQAQVKEGKAINMGEWFRVQGELRGRLDEDASLDMSKNEYHMNLTALKDWKVPADTFEWENVTDTGAKPRIDFILSDIAGAVRGQIKKGQVIAVNGTNLTMGAGDTATIAWMEEETEHTLTVTPTTNGENLLKFSWPEVLSELDADTPVTLTLRIADPESSAVRTAKGKAKIVSA